MAPVRLVSQSQLELIVEFAERNRNIGGKSAMGPLANRQANQAWVELAKNLNAIEDGTKKPPEKWKRYWHLLKCRTKSKAADIRRKRAGTVDGGEQNKLFPLTDLEKRIMRAVGIVGVQTQATRCPPAHPETVPVAARPRPSAVTIRKIQRARSSSDNDEKDLPRWLCDMEKRRITSEERLTDAVVALSTSNESILHCLQEMTETHVKILGILDRHLNPPK